MGITKDGVLDLAVKHARFHADSVLSDYRKAGSPPLSSTVAILAVDPEDDERCLVWVGQDASAKAAMAEMFGIATLAEYVGRMVETEAANGLLRVIVCMEQGAAAVRIGLSGAAQA